MPRVGFRSALALASTLGLLAAAAAADGDAPDSRPASFVPHFLVDDVGFVGRQEARPFRHVSVFAERSEHLLGVRQGSYDLDCGVELGLLRRLRLAGGYRLIDYRLAGDARGVQAQHAGPFVALRLRF